MHATAHLGCQCGSFRSSRLSVVMLQLGLWSPKYDVLRMSGREVWSVLQ
jgi:hypothetical protein